MRKLLQSRAQRCKLFYVSQVYEILFLRKTLPGRADIELHFIMYVISFDTIAFQVLLVKSHEK